MHLCSHAVRLLADNSRADLTKERLCRSPNVDSAVQMCLIKLSEILLKPQDEKVPKVRLRMPTNTTLFQPDLPTPALPKVKLTVGPVPEGPASPPKGMYTLKVGHRALSDGLHAMAESPRLVLKPKTVEQPFNLLASVKKTKAPRAPKLQKFQASGMDMTDYKACGKILKKLVALPISIPFRMAVDPIRDGAPD